MLSCKQVATIASDHLDHNTPLKWQIRLHLLMCANCRRFVRHLTITRELSAHIATDNQVADADIVWTKVKQRLNQRSSPD